MSRWRSRGATGWLGVAVSALLLSGLGVGQAAAAAGPVTLTPVDGATASLTTTVNDVDNAAPWSGDETYGSDASASSTVSGSIPGSRPTGSVTYDRFPNPDCTGDPSSSETVSLSPALTQVGSSPLPRGASPKRVAMSSTGLLATSNRGTDSVSVFSVGSAGALTEVPGSPYDVGSGPGPLAFSPDGSLLAVGNSFDNTISVFSVDPASGALTEVPGSPVGGLSGVEVNSLAFSPSGGLLAADQFNAGVAVFTVDSSTGSLTAVPGSPFASGGLAHHVSFSPDGKWLATANADQKSTVAVLAVDQETGALTPVAGSPFATGNDFGTWAVAFTPQGLLMAANLFDTSISVFTVDSSTGELTQVPGSPFGSASSPVSLSVSPDGSLLTTDDGNSAFQMVAIDEGTGALTELSGSYNGTHGTAFSPEGQWLARIDDSDEVSLSAIGSSVPDSQDTGLIDAGSYAYQARYSGDGNYPATSGPCAAFSLAPAELVIQGVEFDSIYGDQNPDVSSLYYALVDVYDAFLDGEVPPDSTHRFATCTTTAPGDAPPAGTYPITCSGFADPNYTTSYQQGSLEVVPAALSVVAPATTIEYGDPVTPQVLAPQYVGLVNHDATPATPPTCTVPTISGIGVYPVTCSDAADPNYAINYQPGALTVTKAPVTVVAPSKTIRYGDTVPTDLPPTVVSETAADLQTPATCSYPNGITPTQVGTYAVNCSGAVDPNHRIAYQAGTLTILPATLVVAAPNPGITAGASMPALPASYSGFVNGDTVDSLTSPATCTSTATGDTPAAGSYPVTCTGAVDPNYSIMYVAGTFNVTAPAQPRGGVTVVAPSATIRYGDLTPTDLTPTLVASDAVNLQTSPTCAYASGQTPTHVGTYAITCTGAEDSDETISYQPGSLTILPATLVVAAPGPAIVAGAQMPALLPTYAGFMNGDTVASLTSPATCTSTASGAVPAAGSYLVTCAGATDSDYNVLYLAGTLNVLPMQLSVGLVHPPTGPQTGGTTITITGSGFTSGDVVVIGQGHGRGSGAIRAHAVRVLSSTKLTAITGGHAHVGRWHVFVVTPAGTAVPTVNTFAYTRPRT